MPIPKISVAGQSDAANDSSLEGNRFKLNITASDLPGIFLDGISLFGTAQTCIGVSSGMIGISDVMKNVSIEHCVGTSFSATKYLEPTLTGILVSTESSSSFQSAEGHENTRFKMGKLICILPDMKLHVYDMEQYAVLGVRSETDVININRSIYNYKGGSLQQFLYIQYDANTVLKIILTFSTPFERVLADLGNSHNLDDVPTGYKNDTHCVGVKLNKHLGVITDGADGMISLNRAGITHHLNNTITFPFGAVKAGYLMTELPSSVNRVIKGTWANVFSYVTKNFTQNEISNALASISSDAPGGLDVLEMLNPHSEINALVVRGLQNAIFANSANKGAITVSSLLSQDNTVLSSLLPNLSRANGGHL